VMRSQFSSSDTCFAPEAESSNKNIRRGV